MGQFFAPTSTRVSATPRGLHAARVCISVPKYFEEVDLVGWLFMGHTTVGTLDGAPMVRRWHHLEKTAAAIGTILTANAWR